jgi:hypothetical protein
MIIGLGKDGRELSSFQSKEWMNKISKNRKYKNQAKGEGHWNHRLTYEQIESIREYFKDWPVPDTASLFGISIRHVYDILSRKKWKHV